MPGVQKNRKIVITNAARAITTILERHGLTVVLSGDVVVFLLSGMIVPKVSKASTPLLHFDTICNRTSLQSSVPIQRAPHPMLSQSCLTKTPPVFSSVYTKPPYASTISLVLYHKERRIGASYCSRRSAMTHLRSVNQGISRVLADYQS